MADETKTEEKVILPSTCKTVPFRVSYPVRCEDSKGFPETYTTESVIWDNEAPLSWTEAQKPARKVSSFSKVKKSHTQGMHVRGVNMTPLHMRRDECSYNLEEMWPVPNANITPLHHYSDGDLFRIPQELNYCRGDDINMVPHGELTAQAILKNLDRCLPLPCYPADMDMEAYVILLKTHGAKGARSAFRHPTLDVEFPNAPLKSDDAAYGVWKSLRNSAEQNKYVPFNELVDRKDPSILKYFNGLDADLTKDYSLFWPHFPYVAKDHPNRYFSDVANHLRTTMPVWGMFGNDVLARGWNAFAQERYGDRIPAPFFRDSIWQAARGKEAEGHPFKLNILKEIKLPANNFVAWSWSVHNPEKNIALMMGRRGGDVFAIDIDVTNRKVMGQILRIIEEKIGLSPFIRVGSWPKIALLYRAAEGEKIKGRALNFEDKDIGAIEILGEGKPLTAYGVHHSMLSTFQWIGSMTPAEHGPENAPVLTIADLTELLNEINDEVSPLQSYRGSDFVSAKGLRSAPGVDYVYDSDGSVADGRFLFVRDTVFEVVRSERNAILKAKGDRAQTEDIVSHLHESITTTILNKIVVDNGRWTPENISNMVLTDINNLVENAEEKLFRKTEDGKLIITQDRPLKRDADGSLISRNQGSQRAMDASVNRDAQTKRDISFVGEKRVLDAETIEVVRGNHETAIPMPSQEQANRISSILQNTVSSFSELVYSQRETLNNEKPVLLVDAPTGSGKTSRTIEDIVVDPRTLDDHPYLDDKGETKMGRCPIVIAMPTYANIEEAVSRARILCMSPLLTDDELVAELVGQECVPSEEEARRRLPEVRDLIIKAGRDPGLPPLDIQVYTGREQAGCPYKRHLQMLAAAHQPADRLCKAEVKRVNESGNEVTEYEYCPRYQNCAYIAQKEYVKNAHIVFIPHAFVSNGGLPPTLRNARGLIIDEQIHHQFLHTAFIQDDDFKISTSIFRDWTIPQGAGPVAVARVNKHNEEMARFRETMVLRDWLLMRLTQTLRFGNDPATYFHESKERFDMDKWNEISAGSQALEDDASPEAEVSYKEDLLARVEECVYSSEEEEEGTFSTSDAIERCQELMTHLFKQDVRIRPELLNDRVVEKLCQPGVVNADTETKLWDVIAQRIADIRYNETLNKRRQDTVEKEVAELREMAELFGNDDDRFANWEAQAAEALRVWDENNAPRLVHEKDARLQFVSIREVSNQGVSMVETVRFSWRTQPGWDNTPIMLLDASAAPDIISKVFGGRPVIPVKVVEDAGASLNMRIVGVTGHSFSNSSLVASKDATILGRVNAAVNLTNIRDAVTMICGNHAESRVVMGASKNIRQALMTGWQAPPASLDSCHFGAMRGIDAYKKHAASVCIGRMEPPIEIIDAYAACLSYDDEKYEMPFNQYGNGCADADGLKPLFQERQPRTIRMRDGGHVTIQTPMMPGKWGRLVQTQTREEEINQFIGRLRPVYRDADDRPICYVISSIIPEHLILDDIMSIYDITGTDGNTNMVKPMDSAIMARKAVGERLKRQYAMKDVLRAAARNDYLLWPEELAHIDDVDNLGRLPPGYKTADDIYALLKNYGFHMDGHRDENNGFADGWAGIRFDGLDGPECIWTPVSHYKTLDEAISAMKVRVYSVGGNVASIRVLNTPAPRQCFTREMDKVEELAMTGYIMKKARKGAMTYEEMMEAETEANENRRDMSVEFRNGISSLMSMSFPVLDNGVVKEQAPIIPCRENARSLRLYRLSADIIGSLVPGCLDSQNQAIKEDVLSARSREMTEEQIFTLFAIQQVFGPTLDEVYMEMQGLEYRNNLLLRDSIPEHEQEREMA